MWMAPYGHWSQATESQAFMMKIPTAYHEAPTTKFRLF